MTFTFIWLGFLVSVYRAISSICNLDQYLGRVNTALPKVSIVIAVKDGEGQIESTLLRLLNCHYSNLEIIVVNDRSTDKTEEIIQKIKANRPQLIGVQVKELPDGWLGKVHALHEGVKHASGEYVLFMDADVEVNERVLQASVAACLENNLDHLGVLPELIPGDYLYNVMTSTSLFLFVLSAKPWLEISKRPVNSAKGVGAYNFIKRSSFEKTEGFQWLKMDVADDVALAQLIASHGGRSLLMRAGKSELKVAWYDSFKGLVLGLEKNIVGGFANYRASLVFVISFISLLVSIVPVVALSFTEIPAIFYSGIVFLMATFLFAVSIKKFMTQSFFSLLAFPVGITLLGLILLRSAYICYKNDGIKWSGTLYPLKELKAGTRVKLSL